MRGLDRSQPEHAEHREAVFGAGPHRRRRRCGSRRTARPARPVAPPRTSPGRQACRSRRSRATAAARHSRRPAVTGTSGRTAQASVTDARSWPRRRVRRTCVAPTGPSTSGNSIAVTSSPSRNVVTPERTNQSSIGMRRVPAGPATTTSAPYTSRAGAVSAAGDALQMLPASVARFRICTDPTTSAASASAANRVRIVASSAMSVITVPAPITSRPPSCRIPGASSGTRFTSTTTAGRDRPVAQADDQVRPTGQRPRRRAVRHQQPDGFAQGSRSFVGEPLHGRVRGPARPRRAAPAGSQRGRSSRAGRRSARRTRRAPCAAAPCRPSASGGRARAAR